MTDHKVCTECEGSGWVYDYLGGCSDPECCGGPYKVKCVHCSNDWSIFSEEDD